MSRLANSLVKLRDQINAAYPSRSRASDGWLGDSAHAARASDHNANPQGVVCALDLTHDPANGFDAHALADQLRINRHPNLKYIISNGRIADGQNNWAWRKYTGSNPHTKHIHISVGFGPDGKSAAGSYDNQTPWKINDKGEDMPSKADLDTVKRLAQNFFSPEQVAAQGGDKFLQDHVGTETNSLIKAWAESPWNLKYKQRIAEALSGDRVKVVQDVQQVLDKYKE